MNSIIQYQVDGETFTRAVPSHRAQREYEIFQRLSSLQTAKDGKVRRVRLLTEQARATIEPVAPSDAEQAAHDAANEGDRWDGLG